MTCLHAILIAASLLQAPRPVSGPVGPAATTPVLLYEEALDAKGLKFLTEAGAERYFVVYQDNADPQASKSGIIDAAAVARYVVKSQGDTPIGWGVLDFEMPFDQLLHEDPKSVRTIAAVKSMVDAIRTMKRVFPKVKWTYYGMPGLLFYLPDGDWKSASTESKSSEIARQLAAYGPILVECDWLAPCIYYTVGDGRGGRDPTKAVRDATRAWIGERTAMCVKFAKGLPKAIPVIPFASPLFMPGGGARAFSVIPAAVVDEDVLAPAAAAGAVGVCMWTGASNFIGIATGARPGESMTEGGGKSALVRTWAEDLGLSADQLEGEPGRQRLSAMISDAQVAMASLARRRWSALSDQQGPGSGR